MPKNLLELPDDQYLTEMICAMFVITVLASEVPRPARVWPPAISATGSGVDRDMPWNCQCHWHCGTGTSGCQCHAVPVEYRWCECQ